MEDLLRIDSGASPVPTATPWRYRRPAVPGIVEMAIVSGRDVALPIHFHDEDQVTFVVSGRRRFLLKDRLLVISAGEGAFIPAHTPHASLFEPDGVVCFNTYLAAGRTALKELVEAITRIADRDGRLPLGALADLVRFHRASRPAAPAAQRASSFRLSDSVGRAAAREGVSREGFSRRFRNVHGVPPSVFRFAARLNAARFLLRRGDPLAAVAFEAGFADQSHLGRRFRQAFGVTPGQYRAGCAGSHPFQTDSPAGA